MATIQSYVQPTRLYRYRPLNSGNVEREISAITQGYLYCSPYLDLNDPMEGSFSSSKQLRQAERYREIKNAITDTKADIGMCFFQRSI